MTDKGELVLLKEIHLIRDFMRHAPGSSLWDRDLAGEIYRANAMHSVADDETFFNRVTKNLSVALAIH